MSYLHPAELSAAFRTAMVVSAAACAVGGAVAALTVSNPAQVHETSNECLHCALDGPPLRTRAEDGAA